MAKRNKGINLKKVSKDIKKFLKDIGIKDVEINVEEKRITSVFDTSLKDYDDNIIARFDYYTNGLAVFCFTFDRLDVNEQTLRMINEANEKLLFFQVFIDAEKNYMRLMHSVMYVHEDDYDDYVANVLKEFVADSTIEVLTPLCILTEGNTGNA